MTNLDDGLTDNGSHGSLRHERDIHGSDGVDLRLRLHAKVTYLLKSSPQVEADDIMQEVELKLCQCLEYQHIRDFDERLGFATAVARNVIRDIAKYAKRQKRGAGRKVISLNDDETPLDVADHRGEHQRIELLEQIHHALSMLTSRFTRHDIEIFGAATVDRSDRRVTYNDIAIKFGTNKNNVAQIVHKLKSWLEKRFRDE